MWFHQEAQPAPPFQWRKNELSPSQIWNYDDPMSELGGYDWMYVCVCVSQFVHALEPKKHPSLRSYNPQFEPWVFRMYIQRERERDQKHYTVYRKFGNLKISSKHINIIERPFWETRFHFCGSSPAKLGVEVPLAHRRNRTSASSHTNRIEGFPELGLPQNGWFVNWKIP